jgi:hypothetical protein
MKKQTAVEWLFIWMIDNKYSIIEERLQAFEQAKAMEKEQLCYFYVKGAEAEINNPYKSNIEFYNETFSK